jgi:hypothetical protein
MRRAPVATGDPAEVTDAYQEELERMPRARRVLAESHAIVAYQTQQSRRQGIESKASGSLAVAGLISAGVAIVVTVGSGPARFVVLGSIVYLLSGALNVARVLSPRPTMMFTPDSAIGETPSADLLAATTLDYPPTLRASNRATAALSDFAWAGAWLIAALLLAMLGPATQTHQPVCVNLAHAGARAAHSERPRIQTLPHQRGSHRGRRARQAAAPVTRRAIAAGRPPHEHSRGQPSGRSKRHDVECTS